MTVITVLSTSLLEMLPIPPALSHFLLLVSMRAPVQLGAVTHSQFALGFSSRRLNAFGSWN